MTETSFYLPENPSECERNSPRLGIVGGYGPLTSALFCQRVVTYALHRRPAQAPAFIMDSRPVRFADVHDCICGDKEATRRLVRLANAGIRRLAAFGIQRIVIPCNSVHALWEDLSVPVGVDLLHIADPLVARLANRGYRRIGLLASGMTMEHDVYPSRLKRVEIESIRPSAQLQERLNNEIAAFVQHGTVSHMARELLDDLVREFDAQQVEVVALACTDLATILEQGRFSLALPIEDSMDALAEECARYCTGCPSE